MTTPEAREGRRSSLRADWVVRAQDGEAAGVLEEVAAALRTELAPRSRVHALYAQAIALRMTGQGAAAVGVARELCDLCRDAGMLAPAVRARALLIDLLRRQGELEEAAEQLAIAVGQEPALRDLHDPDVQAALGALAVALRHSGVAEEARRVEERLSAVEHELPRQQRVSRSSNLAFEHAVQAMSAARRAPHLPDAGLLRQAVAEIDRARDLAAVNSYDVVAVEAGVLAGLEEAVTGEAAVGLKMLDGCAAVLERGPEALPAQLFWAAGTVRALVRLGRATEAARLGRHVLATVPGSGLQGDRLVLAYEVLRAEHPDAEEPGSGAAEFLALAEDRLGQDVALVSALFRARVDLLRGADERRNLARQASLDALTGLMNRRAAAVAISEAAAGPAGEPVALLLVDLDGFKEVNDGRGHQAGTPSWSGSPPRCGPPRGPRTSSRAGAATSSSSSRCSTTSRRWRSPTGCGRRSGTRRRRSRARR